MSPLAISLRFLQTQPDQRLVELSRAGHERAFEALVRRYRGSLLGYCRRIAPKGTAPEDILQQGLLLAWRSLSNGAEVRDPRAWLYRIVHNVAITAARAGRELPDGAPTAPGAPPVDQLVEQRMAAREALAGLAGLPELQRQVMVSAALDGRSHDEIAAALGLSSGSVRGLIYRARSTLRAAAAAVIPAPVIDWALGDAGGASAGLAGAGAASAGLGALVLKGGAVLAVGAAAGTAGIVFGHQAHHSRDARQTAEAAVVSSPAGRLAMATDPTARNADASIRLDALVIAAEHGATGAGSRSGRGTRSHDGHGRGRSGPQSGGRDGSGDGGGSERTTTGDDRSDGGGSGGGDGPSRGGPDQSGPSSGGPGPSDGSGSDGGGNQATTATTGSSDGGDHGGSTTVSSSGSGSGSTGSSDGGGSSGSSNDGGSSGSLIIGSSSSSGSGSDGGAGGSSDGSSDGGVPSLH